MEPCSLSLKNFTSYRNVTVDLSGISCAALVGINGAGKSSLLDAITWVLYGQATKGGSRDMDNYVTRGQSECQVAMPFNLGDNTFLVRRTRDIAKGKSLLEFLVKTGEDKWRDLGGRTLADTQAIIESTLRMDYRTFTASSLILQGQSDSFTSNMTDGERMDALMRILGLDLWKTLQEQTRKVANHWEGESERLLNQANMYRTQALTKETAEREAATMEAALAKITQDIAAKESEAAGLQAKAQQEPTLRQTLEQARHDLSVRGKERSDLESDLRRQQTMVTDADKYAMQRTPIMEAADMVESLEPDLTELDLKARQVYDLTKQATDARRQADNLRRTREVNMSSVEGQLAAIKKQAALLNEVPCAGEVQAGCKLLAQARAAAASIPNFQAKMNNLATVSPEEAALNIKADTSEAQVKALAYDAEEHTATRDLVNKYRRLAKLKPDLLAAEQRALEAATNITGIQERIAKVFEATKSLDLRVRKAETDLAEIAPIQAKLTTAQAELNRLKTDERRFTEQLGGLRKAATGAENAGKEFAALQVKVDEAREKSKVYRILDQACSKKAGVPKFIVENATPEIERLSNDMLKKVAGGRLAVRLDTQVETKAGDLAEALRITVMDSGFERPYNTFSGAERFLIDLALRVALAKFLANRSGAEVKLFVLDEGLGACDAVNRQAVMDAIQTISQEFSKVLVITHIAELQDAFPQHIYVDKTIDGSKVTISA